jgi:nitrogen fixation/metabolism regulation signal transduction histidine kinase
VTTAYFVGQRITQPVSGLVSAARGFERGDTGTRATTGGPYEIRLLGNAFNQMADTVERRNAALADSERRYRFLFDSNPLKGDADTMQIRAAVEKIGFQFARVVCSSPRDRTLSGARLPSEP